MSDLADRLIDWLRDRCNTRITVSSITEKQRSDDLLSAVQRIAELEGKLSRVRRVTANLKNSAENAAPELANDYQRGVLDAVEAIEGALKDA